MNFTLVYADHFIRIKVHVAGRILQVIWLQQPSSACFRELAQRMVGIALEYHITKVLLDTQARAYLEIADQNWVVQEILPMFKGEKLRIAYLISSLTLEAMDIYRLRSITKNHPQLGKQIKVKSFFHQQMAWNWLLK